MEAKSLILKKKKITPKGDLWYINIPKVLVDTGVIDPLSEYNITITEVE